MSSSQAQESEEIQEQETPAETKDALATTKKRSPSEFLKTILGRSVSVKLNSGTDYKGVLACLDGYMNIAMSDTEEYVDGQLKAKYGDCFIRGNNVLYIAAATTTTTRQQRK